MNRFERITNSQLFKKIAILLLLFSMFSTSIPPQVTVAQEDGFIDAEGEYGDTRNEQNGKDYDRASVNKQVSFGEKPGEYFVDLTITGKDNTKVAKTDIVIPYDLSNSMEHNKVPGTNRTRTDVAAEATKQFIDGLLNSGGNFRIAFVPYGTSVMDGNTISYLQRPVSQNGGKYYFTENNPYNYYVGNFTNNAAEITSKIPSTINHGNHGGTFTQQALERAGQIIATSNADNKIIVTITDGLPTVSYNANRQSWGDGTESQSSQFMQAHRTNTINEANGLKNNYTLYSIGVGLSSSSTAEREVIEGISQTPNHAYYANTVQELVDALTEISHKLSDSIVDGSVEDPMGEYFQLQTDYTPVLTGYKNGEENDSLLNGVNVTPSPDGRNINVTGLNLGADETVKVRYKVQIDTEKEHFESDTLYRTNGDTWLTPRGDKPGDKNKFPEPSASAKGIKVAGEKIWEDFGFTENRPKDIIVKLMNGEKEVDRVTVTPDNDGNWKYEFSDAIWYDSSGEIINYTFDEEPVDGYEMIKNDDKTIVNKLIAVPGISLKKTAKSTSDFGEDAIEVGKDIEYSFTITNTGNLPLKDVTLTDEFEGISEFNYVSLNGEDFTGNIEDLVLQPKDVLVATATYKVTQEDFNHGQVSNHAHVKGTPTAHDPNNPNSPQPVEDDDDANVPGELEPKISLEKSASKESVSKVDEEVTYTFNITNTGNTTLTDVTLNDPMLGGKITLDKTTLNPGETTTVDVTYKVTQADLNAGDILNKADVEGTPPPAYTENPDNPKKVTDEDDEKITSNQKPTIDLVKKGDKKVLVEDETINYTFTATNTGNVTLTNVNITDELEGLSDIEYISINGKAITDPKNITLKPGDVLVAKANYIVTQDDVDYGQVYNEATVTGTDPKGEEVTDKDDEWVPHEPKLGIELKKTSDKQVVTKAGEKIEFTFEVTNTGSVTLTDVEVSDPMLADLDIEIELDKTTLKPGEKTTGKATYTVTEKDIKSGSIKNLATGTGNPPNPDDPKPEDPDEVEVPVAKIELEKSSQPGIFTKTGQEITYTLKVTNSGKVTLNNIVLNDEKLGGKIELEVNSLKPGESTDVEVPYTVTEADVEAGEILNIADVVGEPEGYNPEDENSPQPVKDEDDDKVLYSALSLEKTSDKEKVTKAGEKITYTFKVTNTGKVTLDNVVVNDPMLQELGIKVELEKTTLEPGESTTATATYTVTQEDIDNGGVTNVATSTGTPPGYDPEDPDFPDEPPVSPPSEEEVPADKNPNIELTKVADVKEFTEVGQEVKYTFTVKNTGNVTLKDVKVDDETFKLLVGLSLEGQEGTTESVTLAPGESATGTYTYIVTQADMNNGKIHNIAKTEGTPPPVIDPEDPGNPVEQDPVTDEDDEIVTGEQTSGLSLKKKADKKEVVKAGDEITYTLTVTNTGNMTLENVTVYDKMLGGKLEVEPSTLAPGEVGEATGTYTVTQEDIDNKLQIENIATATGTPPGKDPEDPDNPKTPPAEENVPVTKDPAITLVKQADKEMLVEGDTITYTFTATNSGNVTLTNVNITDILEGISAIDYISINDEEIVDLENIVLAPGDVLVANATYQVTQKDVDNNEVTNHATVEGTPPPVEDPNNPGEVIEQDPVTDDDDAKVPAKHKPAIELEKSSNKEKVTKAGEVITYKFTITNTGNVTLENIEVNDPMLEELGIKIEYEKDILVPGESTVGYAEYTVTQEDIDNKTKIKNVATSTGTPPGYDPENPPTDPEDPTYPPVSPPDEEEVPVEKDPDITIVKTSDKKEVSKAGETITYTFTVTNTGNVTLKDVKVDDPMLAKAGIDVELEKTTLAPGESTKGSAKYKVTQADIDSGLVKNVATSTGTPPGYDPENPPTDPEDPTYPPVSPPGEVEVPTKQVASIKLVKSADRTDLAVNKDINYTFIATNTGNVSLSDVTITDILEGISDIKYESINGKEIANQSAITLEPGDVLVAEAWYTITQTDVDHGKVENHATVIGKDPKGKEVTDEDKVTVPQEQTPSIQLEKSSDVEKVSMVNQEVTYTFKVTNTGNVTLNDVSLNDPMLGGKIDLGQATLLPGESTIATAKYKTTEDDLANTEIINIAEVTGTTQIGKSVTDKDRNVILVEKQEQPKEPGNPLPNTATDIFKMIISGAGLLVIAIVILLANRRRREA